MFTVFLAPADVEPEEYDLGTDSRQDQAFDVDDGVDGAVDSDALDSDAEGLDNETLRIDAEETDCKSNLHHIIYV